MSTIEDKNWYRCHKLFSDARQIVYLNYRVVNDMIVSNCDEELVKYFLQQADADLPLIKQNIISSGGVHWDVVVWLKQDEYKKEDREIDHTRHEKGVIPIMSNFPNEFAVRYDDITKKMLDCINLTIILKPLNKEFKTITSIEFNDDLLSSLIYMSKVSSNPDTSSDSSLSITNSITSILLSLSYDSLVIFHEYAKSKRTDENKKYIDPILKEVSSLIFELENEKNAYYCTFESLPKEPQRTKYKKDHNSKNKDFLD